jgi:Tol biopolymer transport system component
MPRHGRFQTMIGQTISHYRVLDKLGTGGMGEVYRATDSRLGRDVALKVLPAAFAQDAERMARFEREAQLLASLNHPHIAAIYGLEVSSGIRALAMELVEGPTLAERIKGAQIPLEETLSIARQIAEALEYAHERGIIHRDLKPANVKLTPDGKVKVLDFGLAKALEDSPAAADMTSSPTLSMAATKAGIILGTAAYMSPEQAKGKAADRRADIWSFGVVLYEMLTGRQAYLGETAPETMAHVITRDPDWTSVPPGTPPRLQQLLRRCLTKDPKQRLQAIGEARLALDEIQSGSTATEMLLPASPARSFGVREIAGLSVGGVLLAALAGFSGWWLKSGAPESPVRKFDLTVPDLGHGSGLHGNFAISPDGKQIAYLSSDRLWIRALDRVEPREVPGSAGVQIPFWSPDSAYVGFAANGKLWKAPAAGGETTTICDLRGALIGGSGASWGEDGTIVFSRGGTGILQVSARGGDPRSFLDVDPQTEQDLHQPYFLPEGRGVIYSPHRKGQTAGTLMVFSGGKKKILLQLEGQSIWNPVYSRTGHILYRRQMTNAGVWALPFSLSKLEVTGEPFLVAPNADNPSVAADGTLLYEQGTSGGGPTQLVWMNRSGQVIGNIGQPQPHQNFPALSPDGQRVAVAADEGENTDIWIHDAVRNTKTRLTFEFTSETAPAWSPRGDRIAFQVSNAASTFAVAVKAADGTGDAKELAKPGNLPSLSPDGKFLAYSATGPETDIDIFYIPLAGDQKPVPFLQTKAREAWPQISPDGRFVAYQSNETGVDEVYIKLFPSGEGKWQVSVHGGDWPHWNRKGDRLYYAETSSIMEVEVTARPTLSLSTPKKLFTHAFSGVTRAFGWPDPFDVSGDGQKFVLVQPVAQERNKVRDPAITVVENWFAEFKEKEKK